VAGSRALALNFTGLVAMVIAVGCGSGVTSGGFEDDLDTGDASPPDLPQPECDPLRDDACEAGLKCSYVIDPELGPTNRCVKLLGEGLAGEPCSQLGDSDDCADQHLCWAIDDDGLGMCVGFCSPTLTCESELDTCSVSNGDLLSLCLRACDPIAQDCGPEWGCYADDYGRWACDRDRSGIGGAHGEPCECLNCCDPGLVCMPGALVDADGCGPDGAAGCCANLCEVDPDGVPVDPVCPTELEGCVPFYESNTLLMGYEHVGICRL
jgi:hypothetical protein